MHTPITRLALRSLAAITALLTLSAPVTAHASVEAWVTTRVALGTGVTNEPQRGMSFASALSAGVKLVFPVPSNRAWTLTPDAGIAWRVGYGDANTTLASLGLSPGHLWGYTGVAWTPRVLLGTRDDGAGVWGVRNGIRVNFLTGLVDVEVAHQFLRATTGDEHEVQFMVGIDPGQLVHMLFRMGPPTHSRSA
jgi:hypothetical protein